jgi:hypothetical protein
LRVVSGIAAFAILAGLVLPMLPFEDEWHLSWPPLVIWVTLAALAFWFAARGSVQRHRRAFLYSAAAAVSLAVVGDLAISAVAPIAWPEWAYAARLFGSMAGALGCVIGASVGPITLLRRRG